MSEKSLSINEVLDMIQNGKIKPEEGYRLINELKSRETEGTQIKATTREAENTGYPSARVSDDDRAQGAGTGIFEHAVNYLKSLLSQVIKLPTDRINAKQPLENYGVDSVVIMEMNNLLEKNFESLPKTLLFEYGNLHDLAGYFEKNHAQRLKEILGISEDIDTRADNKSLPPQPAAAFSNVPQDAGESEVGEYYGRFRFMSNELYEEDVNIPRAPQKDEDIAIIGISGMFPMANDMEIFWENLKNGKMCITEVPSERWDHSKYFDPQKGKRGKVYSKWGGFVEYYDCFDPLFFQMTPRDAEMLDPQERLFLECVYNTVEDAGYTRASLSNSKTGVYVGVMYGHYQLYGAEESLKGNVMALSSSYASIANRVSYYFNFQGPSIAMDTMCSSSLTSLHLACESIHRGESDMAIAGGVNLTIHPDKYLFLCSQRFASSEGRCRAFGEGGDGYVPGEGVGALLLKPLSKAKADKDNIYAVIKATAANHGGKTNGYTVPNPNAQAGVIAETLKKSGVNPRTISYIEAHGTGTSLGDPIEITGLSKTYREYTQDKQYCAIGSVKTNVGHLESAAGVVSIAKVILQMKNKQLVPSLLSEKLNPNINFKDSPFYVQHKLEEWKQPVIKENGVEKKYPRRAGISSFGAGGANVHVLMEEYENPINLPSRKIQGPYIFVLTAKNADRLKVYAERIVKFIRKNTVAIKLAEEVDQTAEGANVEVEVMNIAASIIDISVDEMNPTYEICEYGFDKVTLTELATKISEKFDIEMPLSLLDDTWSVRSISSYLLENHRDSILRKKEMLPQVIESTDGECSIDIVDFVYTLQVGREALEERLAIVASDIKDIREKLEAFVLGQKNIENLYRGNAKNSKNDAEILLDDEEGEEFIRIIFKKKKYSKLCRLWVSGIDIDWNLLYTAYTPARMSIPGYPFERNRYWVPRAESYSENYLLEQKNATLHPMIDTNESTLEGQFYKKVLSSDDFYMRDHVVSGNMLLPGVAYLEMAWAAGTLATSRNRVAKLRNVLWSRPVQLNEDFKEIFINLYPDGTSVEYDISSYGEGNTSMVHFKGKLDFESLDLSEEESEEYIDIEAIKERCGRFVDGDDCYSNFNAMGLAYGPTFRSIKELYVGDNEAIARLELSQELEAEFKSFTIHPSLADGAMQTAAGLLTGRDSESQSVYVPFAMDEILVLRPVTQNCYSFVSLAENSGSTNSDVKKFNIMLIDDQGRIAVKFNGFSGRELKNSGTSVSPAAGSKGNSTKGVTKAAADTDTLDKLLKKLENGELDADEAEKLMEVM